MGRRLLLGLAALLAGCSPIVDGEFSDIEVTRPDITIPAVTTATQPAVTFSFSIDSTPLGANANPEAQDGIVSVKLHRLALTAKSGVTDLSFIETLHALACVPISKTSTLSSRQVELADYEREFDLPALESLADQSPYLRQVSPLLADGVIKLSAGKKRHALVRPA